jgi:hypothetical protein
MLHFTTEKNGYSFFFILILCSLPGVVFAQPANDNVVDAIEVTVDGMPTMIAPMGATAESGEDVLTPPNSTNCAPHTWCDTDGITRSTWYKFTAPASGAVRVDLCGSTFDSQLATFSATDVNDFGTFSLLDASDDVEEGPDGNACGPGDPGAYLSSWHDHGCLTPGGTYYVIVDIWSNDEGVTAFTEDDTVAISVSSLPDAAAVAIDSISFVSPACTGLANGSATVSFTGTYPWTILWSTGDTTESIGGLSTGSYTVTVTDFCGTSASMMVELPDGQPPVEITFEENTDYIFDPSCEGTGGQIQVQPISGIFPFTYTWSTGDTTATIRDLAPGEYTVTVADACGGDPAIQTIILEENTGTDVDAGDDVELCNATVEIGPNAPMTSSAELVGYSVGIAPEGNVACRGGGLIAQNTYYRPIELASYFGYEGFLEITGVEFFYSSTPGDGYDNFIPGVEVALLLADNVDLSIASFTEFDRAFLSLEGTNDETASYRVPLNAFVSATEVLVVELTINAASTDGHTFDFRSTSDLPFGATPTYLVSSDCGITTPTTTGAIGFPDDHVIANVFVANPSDFSYQWDNTANLDDPTAQNPLASAAGIYNVTITDNNCNTTVEDVVEVFECGVNSVVDPSFHSFLVNPNPSSGAFHLRNEGEGRDIRLQIHDLQGREIIRKDGFFGAGDTQELDLSAFASGIYLLQMTYNNRTEVHRLVVQ